jgi:hypothetical protein
VYTPTCKTWILASVLCCALGAAGQSLPVAFADLVRTSAVPVRSPHIEATANPAPSEESSSIASADAPKSSAESTAGPPDGASASSSADAEGQPNDPANTFTPVPHQKTKADDFQWRPALGQYSLEIAIQHAWRFAHEDGTRDATGYGPWFQDWIHSIGETRGWDDGDGWHAGYVGHPLNGAIYGFIERQNDPLYRQVEWGDGHIYWMSLLRSTAFAAVGSTQWTLGPVSEASLGNVQLHASPGFIDLVTTPGLGVFVMMGEDLLDRYVITPLENHTANPYLILVARALGNPARSFANLMAFKEGWDRPTRMGIFHENHERRKELVKEYKEGLISAPFGPHTAEERALMNKTVERPPSKEADVELQPYAVYESFLGGGSCMGGGGQGAARVNPAWQVVAEVNGCMIINSMPKYQSGDSTMFAIGPRWTPLAAHRFSPFAEVMFGGRRITHDYASEELKEQLLDEWNKGELAHFPKRSDYMVQYQQFGFAMSMGGGFDAVFGRAFAWRVLDVQYTRSWMPPVDPINAQQGVQVRTGVVLRIGTW